MVISSDNRDEIYYEFYCKKPRVFNTRVSVILLWSAVTWHEKKRVVCRYGRDKTVKSITTDSKNTSGTSVFETEHKTLQDVGFRCYFEHTRHFINTNTLIHY